MHVMAFKQLQVGDVFRFHDSSGGPWEKISARTYLCLSNGLTSQVRTINVQVNRLATAYRY